MTRPYVLLSCAMSIDGYIVETPLPVPLSISICEYQIVGARTITRAVVG